MRQKFLAWLLLFPVVAALAYYTHDERPHLGDPLTAKLEKIVSAEKYPEVSCAEIAATRPLVLLILGQSNAGNHGSPPTRVPEPLTIVAEGKCLRATDPLPGATGTGGSIWQHLPAWLSTQKNSRSIVLSLLAVDATSIDDWTRQNSPLAERLVAHVASMRYLGLPPTLVLWQQGEADALRGTSADNYSRGLAQLAELLEKADAKVPILLARSTLCRSAPSSAIRSAIETAVSSDPRFRLGPDTDTLAGDFFRQGCHFTAEGLDSAAKMWAETIRTGQSPP